MKEIEVTITIKQHYHGMEMADAVKNAIKSIPINLSRFEIVAIEKWPEDKALSQDRDW